MGFPDKFQTIRDNFSTNQHLAPLFCFQMWLCPGLQRIPGLSAFLLTPIKQILPAVNGIYQDRSRILTIVSYVGIMDWTDRSRQSFLCFPFPLLPLQLSLHVGGHQIQVSATHTTFNHRSTPPHQLQFS